MGMTPHGTMEREQMDCPSAALKTAIESGDLEVIRRVAEDAGKAAATALFDRATQRPEMVRRIEAVLFASSLVAEADPDREEIAKLAADIADAVA